MSFLISFSDSYGSAAAAPLDAKTLSDTPPDGVDSITWNLSSPIERADLISLYRATDYEEIVVIAPDKPLDGGGSFGGGDFGGSGFGGVGGGVGPAPGQGTQPNEIPLGFTPVGDGTKYMKDSEGKIHLTPAWENKVNSGEIDWAGVAADLAWIAGVSVGGLLVNVSKYAVGALALGLAAYREWNNQPPPPEEPKS